jgi:hypothetical protein
VTIVYFDCSSGVSANMVFAALVDAGADPEALRSSMATLPLGPLDLDIAEVDRGGLRARRVTVRARSDEPRTSRTPPEISRCASTSVWPRLKPECTAAPRRR